MSRAAAVVEARLEAHLRSRVRLALGGMLIKLLPVEKGVPDRLVLLPGGRMHLVELKTDAGRLSDLQKHWHGRALEMGTTVTVLRGKDEIDAWVRERAADYDPPEARQFERPRHLRSHEVVDVTEYGDTRRRLKCAEPGCAWTKTERKG